MVKKEVKKSGTKKSEVKKSKIDTSLISYILGILSIVEAFFLPLSGLIFGIIGLVFSGKEKNLMGRKAKILNIVGIVLGAIFTIAQIYLAVKGLTKMPAGM